MSRSIQTAVTVFVLLCGTGVEAHVSITPRQSTHGATEKYTIRIPTEGTTATVGADIEFPAGVIVETIQAPAGWTYEVKRMDDRIVSMSIKADVKPYEFIEVAFVARNPRSGMRIVWTLRQRFADGTVTDWTNGPNGQPRATAITQLRAAAPATR
jgi:uncharacterized protein YcnI